jgi:predicted MFS family arabinose efflux permease
MADHVTWRAGFGFAAAAGILYAGVLAWKLPAPPEQRRAAGSAAAGLISLLRSPCYLALNAAFFAFCAMLWVFYAWYPNFLYERYGLSMTDSGFNATVFVQASCGAGVVAGGILGDRLSKRIPAARIYVAAAGILLSAPFGYLTYSVPALDLARLCSALYGGFAGLMIANIFAAAYDVVNPRAFGLGAGVLNMTGGFSAAAIIFLAGLWKSTIGFSGLMQWVAAACVVSALALSGVAAARFGSDHLAARATAAEPICTT